MQSTSAKMSAKGGARNEQLKNDRAFVNVLRHCVASNACGLYDLERRPRQVVEAYRMLLKEFGQITIVPHGEMFEITSRAAKLKVAV